MRIEGSPPPPQMPEKGDSKAAVSVKKYIQEILKLMQQQPFSLGSVGKIMDDLAKVSAAARSLPPDKEEAVLNLINNKIEPNLLSDKTVDVSQSILMDVLEIGWIFHTSQSGSLAKGSIKGGERGSARGAAGPQQGNSQVNEDIKELFALLNTIPKSPDVMTKIKNLLLDILNQAGSLPPAAQQKVFDLMNNDVLPAVLGLFGNNYPPSSVYFDLYEIDVQFGNNPTQ